MNDFTLGSYNDRTDDVHEELEITSLEKFIKNGKHEYKTAHTRLCFAIIARIYRRLKQGYRFGAIKISEGEMIVDGNHRYVAYKLANIEFEVIEGTRSHSDQLKSFKDIDIDVKHDWDKNHESTRKFCTDDFLIKEKFIKLNK